MVLKAKITTEIYKSKLISIDKRAYIIDPNIKRIAINTYLNEIKRINTIKKSYYDKKGYMLQCKKQKNLLKKSYIDQLRDLFNEYLNIRNIYILKDSIYYKEFKKHINSFKNDLLKFKITKNTEFEFYKLLSVYIAFQKSGLYNRLVALESDIKLYESKIKDFDNYYNNLFNLHKKLNSYDIKQLKKGKITENAKTFFYYYLINLKKGQKHNIRYKNTTHFLLDWGLLSESDINNLIEKNLNIAFCNKFKINPDNNKGFSFYDNVFNENILKRYL